MPTNTDKLISPGMLEQIKMRLWAKVRQLAPSHLTPFITSDTVSLEQRKDGGYGVAIRILPRKDALTADARAQEYGSGLHATRKGFRSPRQQGDGRILITPKSPKPYLVFYWEKKGNFVKRKSVLHPGIRPYNQGRGYMREALAQSKDKITEEVGQDAVKQLRLKVRTIFSRPGGKNK